jgi:hypothetical protein
LRTHDENKHLLGFENGVYDLYNGEFRDGRPEDMLSQHRRHSRPSDEALYLEIMDFFCKVFPDENYGVHAWSTGVLPRQAMSARALYIFTGSGPTAVQDHRAVRGIIRRVLLQAADRSSDARRRRSARRAARTKPAGCPAGASGESERLNVGRHEGVRRGTHHLPRASTVTHRVSDHSSMVLTCNTLPAVPDNDGGTWRRIRVIQFDSKFVSEPTKTNEFETRI